MGKAISLEQGFQGLMALATNVDWRSIDGDIFQSSVIDDPRRAGAEMTIFLQNRARVMRGEPKILKIENTEDFNLRKFVQDSTIWKGPADGNGLEGEEDIDRRSLGLSEVDLSKICLYNGLEGDETFITGEEKLRRLKALKHIIRFGGNVFRALWDDHQANKGSSCLGWLQVNREAICVDFPGLVLRNPKGNRFSLYFCFDGTDWDWNYRYLSRNSCSYTTASLGLAVT